MRPTVHPSLVQAVGLGGVPGAAASAARRVGRHVVTRRRRPGQTDLDLGRRLDVNLTVLQWTQLQGAFF